MQRYLRKFKKTRTTHMLGKSLEICTARENLTTPEGRAKYQFGLETITLQIRQKGKQPLVLAKLSESVAGLQFSWNSEQLQNHQEEVKQGMPTLLKILAN